MDCGVEARRMDPGNECEGSRDGLDKLRHKLADLTREHKLFVNRAQSACFRQSAP